jgi:hypothetical protein
MYDLESMKRLVGQCDINIQTFEAAIDKELQQKKEYMRIVRQLEEQEDGDTTNRSTKQS